MFEFVVEKLNNKTNPFFATIMTASDHGPYIIPEYFKPKNNDIKKQIVEYADWSLKKFIKLAEKTPWFDNTIFVFIADHGAAINVKYTMPLNYHHSPLIFFAPKILNNKIINDIGGQIDVYPTIMGLLNIEYINNTFGIDLLKEKRKYIYFCADDKFGVLDSTFYFIETDNNKFLYKYRQKDLTNYIDSFPDKAKEMEIFAKSNIQAAFYISNNFISP